MKCFTYFLLFILVTISGCTLRSPKPSFKLLVDTRETTKEEYLPSGNLIKRETTKEDHSSSSPMYAPAPEPPTFLQKVRNFFIKYSIVLGIVIFLCPTVGVIIMKFLLNRSRSALTQVAKGIKEFTDKDDTGNRELFNSLSRNMDRKSKDIIKKITP